MSIITLLITFLWFLTVFSFTGADQTDIDCLKTVRSQVEDPNGYLRSWDFRNETEGFICKFAGVTCWHDDENRVLSIKLSGYGLKGKFPLGFEGCSDITGLDLSRNNLSGSLPSNIDYILPSVTVLGLSYNNFSGEIPINLRNITFLNTLMLQHNKFTGKIPPQLASLRRLKEFSVADNRLTGPVPSFDPSLKIGAESYANNSGLCGLPLDACVDQKEELIWLGEDQKEELIWLGEIGAAVGASIFVPVGAGLGWFFSNRKKQSQGNRRYRSRF